MVVDLISGEGLAPLISGDKSDLSDLSDEVLTECSSTDPRDGVFRPVPLNQPSILRAWTLCVFPSASTAFLRLPTLTLLLDRVAIGCHASLVAAVTASPHGKRVK